MDMSWMQQNLSRRRVLTGATGLAAGALLPPEAVLAATSTYTNPVIWQDFADVDVIRVGDTYYASASTMHYSPGAPVLRSYDLVHWGIAGHSVPVLDFGAEDDLNGARGYVRGTGPRHWPTGRATGPSTGSARSTSPGRTSTPPPPSRGRGAG
ncbi:xylosidase [Streptomyces canarius]